MNLKNGEIMIKELLANENAKKILFEELPDYKNSPFIRMAGGYSLKQGIKIIGNKLPKSKIDKILERLKKV